nr:hypothetical protein [Tanacetum cinerariifolium]
MRNYHRSRGHAKCAFKIDIEKAYDYVKWDFLANCLKFFGFHDTLVKWVMNCISSTSFTINVNGEHKGFFKGMRGLRQGDPLSPYLFTLIMEVLNLVLKREIEKNPLFRYHWLCKEKALSEFSGMSGLLPNCSKSTIFLGNVRECCKRKILDIVPFKECTLPVRYLGVPTRFSTLDFMSPSDFVARMVSRCSSLILRESLGSTVGKSNVIAIAGKG